MGPPSRGSECGAPPAALEPVGKHCGAEPRVELPLKGRTWKAPAWGLGRLSESLAHFPAQKLGSEKQPATVRGRQSTCTQGLQEAGHDAQGGVPLLKHAGDSATFEVPRDAAGRARCRGRPVCTGARPCPYPLPAAVRMRPGSTVSHSFPSRLHFKRLSFRLPPAATSFSTSMYMEGSELTWGRQDKSSGELASEAGPRGGQSCHHQLGGQEEWSWGQAPGGGDCRASACRVDTPGRS